MEGNERIGTGQDTRERLESEIDEWCAEHFNSSFSGRAFNLILEWLDRQAAITERYWMHLCGCTTRASVEISKKLKAAEAENEDLRKELETAKRECVKVNRLESSLRKLTTKHEGLIWQLTDGLLSKASTPNESVVSEVEEWHRRQCDKEHSDLVAENEGLRKELEAAKRKCDSLQFKADDAAIRRASERREKDAQIRRLYDCIVRLKAKSKHDADAIETLTEQLDVLCDQRAMINRQRDVISRFKTAYDAVRGLFDDDAMSALGIEVEE